jgi:predicted  nucleic acid-binding Zn-ribbon protein
MTHLTCTNCGFVAQAPGSVSTPSGCPECGQTMRDATAAEAAMLGRWRGAAQRLERAATPRAPSPPADAAEATSPELRRR